MGMSAGRIVVLVTCLVVAGLCGWFIVVGWEDADRVAAVSAAVAGVAAVGVSVWAVLRAGNSSSVVPGNAADVEVSDTGDAKAGAGGRANSGVRGAGTVSPVRVRRTGKAISADGGEANTGVEL